MTVRFIAMIDGAKGAYGVSFPDAPGCTAMGKTVDEAMKNAVVSLGEWVNHSRAEGFSIPNPKTADEVLEDEDIAELVSAGAVLASVPLIVETGRQIRANLSIDSGLLVSIDMEAERLGLTRSSFLSRIARERIEHGV